VIFAVAATIAGGSPTSSPAQRLSTSVRAWSRRQTGAGIRANVSGRLKGSTRREAAPGDYHGTTGGEGRARRIAAGLP
jgi:hypothetical protein